MTSGARAMVWGAFIGIPLGLSNLVVGLKVGLGVGVALTAVGFAAVLRRTPLFPTLSPQDAAMLQSVASAAGYSAGSATASVLAASMLAGEMISWPLACAWTLGVAAFGTALGWTWHRNAMDLPFPSATAAAASITSTWTTKERPDATAPRAWILGTLLGLALTVVKRLAKWLPATALPAGTFGLGIELSPLAFGIGALLGLRLGLSIAIAGALIALVEGPALGFDGLGTLAGWNVWPATALLSAAALTHLVAGLRLRGAFDQTARRALAWSFVPGAALGALCVFGFGAPWWAAALAVLTAPLACVISIRMTGETDVTPGAPLAMGLQLAFGLWAPFSPGVQLASAGVLAGASASAADLVSDVKTGTLVGLEPRRQLTAQLVGCVVGALVAGPALILLTQGKVGTELWPAPAAQMFLATGRAAAGEAVLSTGAQWACVVALLGGIALALIERHPRLGKFVPSPMGIGLAMLVPPSLGVTIGLGAVVAHALRKKKWVTPAASGLMLGETTGELTAALHDAL
ncbi:MAG: OPT/YSL family transporter [Archangium sp.]|nr:OPT/YSL family transporter [Archangium sp.]